MNLRTNNPLNSERAVHYKLYKSGKLWIVMGLSVISFIGSTAFTTTFAHADNNVPNQTIVTAAKSKASIEDTDSLTTTSQSSDQASLTASSSNSATTASVQAATMDSTANSNNRPTSQVSTTAVNDSTSQSTSQVAASAVSKSQANIQIASNATAVSSAKPATRVRAMATSPVAMQTKPTAYKIQSKQIIRNQYQWQGNNLYYYGNDGQPITGLRHYSNNKLEYYGTDHVQYRNRYASQGNQLYYFGSNGDAVTGLRHYGNNKLEYYGTDHVQYRNRYASQGNQLYYFGSNGDAVTGLRHYGNNKLEYYGTDHVQYRNRYASQGNQLYYFGSNGDAVTGLRHYGNNKLEYYGADHVQYRNRYYQEGNKFYYFGGNGDAITGLRHYGNNKLEYYGTDHVQYRNSYANVGNTRYYFGSNGDAVSTNRPQTEADIIGSMRVAQKAQQIVTVVQDGESTATLKLWQKQGDTWRNILISSSRIGNGGIGNSHEGSSTTPKGVYHLSFAFGKGATAQTAGMSYRQIKPTSYWIEDQNDRQYNTWQDRSWANNKNEHLIDYTKAAPHNQYELAVVMDNQGQNNGSGFFIHVKNQWPTEGCVSISLSDMRTLVSHLGTKAYVVDVQNQAQLKNY
ncbi:KxYKxGKxW signal peptide domain-containing protein (plasmid) [Lactiplantibacillus plantarum subsp. plantarum]|uniref:KxYKxGKxW signal peptide domain-containing protein n=1 Tax=Lactiplantibacillus plantarum TaxID=1590 RepID=UPI001BDE4161|nr:KxYKxGKxW signal peptide domain-containing protein [Lactiplantibacillus plantarum]UNB89006.1 KxYKxGKxW signal peptide domain-containing protein [Lactiplantibacillus plantarum]UOF06458.1 KxYKxGKxW signal peptide domain-containing protein [Lactiplantibacillus plantarum subsp. plantarum]